MDRQHGISIPSLAYCIGLTFFLITGDRPLDLQCEFGNHWKQGLSRPGHPIVQVTADLGP